MAKRIVVVGGGVGGLTAALALGRAGHEVTVIERDVTPEVADADAAFEAVRHGAPQVHQTHGFLARLQVLLRDRFPDVFDSLLAAGATTMPTIADLGEPQEGDEDLRVIILRRTTLDWVLRQAAAAQPGVEVRSDVAIAGLVVDGAPVDGVPVVSGVRCEDGSTVPAEVVIAANGRRAPLPSWAADIGAEVTEEIRASGLVYVSRWYRWDRGLDEIDAKLGGDLGFVKYLGVPGDGGTLSVTLAVRADDPDLRAALNHPDRFDLACRLLPGPDQFFRTGPMEPLGGVRPMGGLLNRLRRFVDEEGRPRMLGFHAIGDAHTCTNPLYGRGCSLAAVQATMVADALAEHPDDAWARAAAYETACTRDIEPWYHSAVQLDRMGSDPMGGLGADGPPSEAAKGLAAVFNAAATDPVIGRTIARVMNMLILPTAMTSDPEFVARAAQVMADPDAYPPPPRTGPSRAELLDALAA